MGDFERTDTLSSRSEIGNARRRRERERPRVEHDIRPFSEPAPTGARNQTVSWSATSASACAVAWAQSIARCMPVGFRRWSGFECVTHVICWMLAARAR